MQPPEVRNESYPRGYQLLPGAPLSDWRQVPGFDSETACEEAGSGGRTRPSTAPARRSATMMRSTTSTCGAR